MRRDDAERGSASGGRWLDLSPRSEGDKCWGLAVQADGKILVGWDSPRKTPVERLLPDGAADPTFHSVFAAARWGSQRQRSVREKVVIPRDGKILLAGPVEAVCGGCIRSQVRLNANGSLDKEFPVDLGCQPDKPVDQDAADFLAVLPDGSMVIHMHYAHRGGHELICLDPNGAEVPNSAMCGSLQGAGGGTVAYARDGGMIVATPFWFGKVRSDGTLDRTFHERNGYLNIRPIVLPDDKILTVNSGATLWRLDSDGTPDASFHPTPLRAFVE